MDGTLAERGGTKDPDMTSEVRMLSKLKRNTSGSKFLEIFLQIILNFGKLFSQILSILSVIYAQKFPEFSLKFYRILFKIHVIIRNDLKFSKFTSKLVQIVHKTKLLELTKIFPKISPILPKFYLNFIRQNFFQNYLESRCNCLKIFVYSSYKVFLRISPNLALKYLNFLKFTRTFPEIYSESGNYI